jgi:hypothetical protein
MKFTKIGPNKVQADQGFVFWIRNPFNLHYSEAEREIVIPGEMLTGEKELLVSISAIKSWGHPFDREIIDQAKKKQIAVNVAAALDFLGVKYEFD